MPTMPPSWQDADHSESMFPDSIGDLLSAEQQMQQVIELGKSGLVSEYMRIRNAPHNDTFINARLVSEAGRALRGEGRE